MSDYANNAANNSFTSKLDFLSIDRTELLIYRTRTQDFSSSSFLSIRLVW